MTKNTGQYIWISNLRVLATICVLLIHTSMFVLNEFGKISVFDWWIGNIYNSISRFAVPVFVMITGALLLPQEIGIKSFLKKRLNKILLPFLFWSILYIAYEAFLLFSDGTVLTMKELLCFVYFKLINGAAFHLWYIYMIIGIYLLIPILRKWIKNATEKEILYFLLIWFITLFAENRVICKYFPNIDLRYFTGFIGYLILGYYLLIKRFDKIKNIQFLSLLMIFIGFAVTAIGTYIASIHLGSKNSLFGDYLTPNVLLSSIGMFLFVKNVKHLQSKMTYINTILDKYTYGIYLSHMLILVLLSKFTVWNILLEEPLIGIPLITLMCLTGSFIIVYVINKLPFGKYISG